MRDLAKAFTYMFEDENWLAKMLVGSVFVLLSFMLIGIPFLMGYSVETIQNVMAGRTRPLPEWTDLGDKFVKGLFLGLALLIWAIPVLLLWGLGFVFFFVAVATGEGAVALLGSGALLLYWGAGFIYQIALGLVTPAIYIKYAEKPEFGSAFKVGEFVSMIRGNLGNFVVVFLLSYGASMLAGYGFVALCIGVLFTTFWSYLVTAHLYGQLGRSLKKTEG